MGKDSKIEWTNHTWNPWTGCQRISPGCKFCFMHRDMDRYGQDGDLVQITKKPTFTKPLSIKEPSMVFTCSWSDFFLDDILLDSARLEAWKIIKQTPHLTYQILTKRPENIAMMLPDDWGTGYQNVWLGVSIETNEYWKRAEILCETPAKVRFLSVEPILDSCLTSIEGIMKSYYRGISWVIIGAESGNETGKWKYRPAELEWFTEIVELCQKENTAVFVKQLGTYLAKKWKLKDRHGRDISEFPSHLQVREFPIETAVV